MSAERRARRLDPSTGIPLYVQLRAILQQEVGSLAPGERLSSETEITKRYHVSRSTVRQAFADLENAGLVNRRRGAGTFVSHRRQNGWQIQSERGWHDEMSRRGHIVRTGVFFNDLDVPPQWVSEALELEEAVPAIRIDRVRSVDDNVATFVRSYLHPELCQPVLAAELGESSSLYGWLEANCGLWVSGGTRTISAVVANDDLSAKLEVARGTPLLLVQAVSTDAGAGPFEVYEAWHRADLTSVVVSVVPGGSRIDAR